MSFSLPRPGELAEDGVFRRCTVLRAPPLRGSPRGGKAFFIHWKTINTMPGLRALTYTSTAKQLLSRPQIDHLLTRSRERNAHEGVTGVLLYSNGQFMQYLEGPELGVSKIWQIIRADPLHHEIVEHSFEVISLREFEQWSMAFRALGSYGMSHPMHLDALLSGRFSENTKSTSLSIKALLAFWSEHRGPAAF